MIKNVSSGPKNSSQGYNTCIYAMWDHPIASLGPPKRPVLAQKGPFGGPGHPVGSELVPTATGWSNWVGCIHIMCLGLIRDLCGTPGAPKGPALAPNGPFGGPMGPDLVPTAADWSHWVGIMVNTHFGLETNLFWAPMGPKRVCFGPNFPFLGFSLWDVRCAFLVILGPYDTWYGPKRLFGPNSEASMAPFLLDIFCSKYMLVGCWTGYHTLSTDIGPLLRCERTTRNHVFVGVFRYDSGTPKHALELKKKKNLKFLDFAQKNWIFMVWNSTWIKVQEVNLRVLNSF